MSQACVKCCRSSVLCGLDRPTSGKGNRLINMSMRTGYSYPIQATQSKGPTQAQTAGKASWRSWPSELKRLKRASERWAVAQCVLLVGPQERRGREGL
jgi:hypothetical protein